MISLTAAVMKLRVSTVSKNVESSVEVQPKAASILEEYEDATTMNVERGHQPSIEL